MPPQTKRGKRVDAEGEGYGDNDNDNDNDDGDGAAEAKAEGRKMTPEELREQAFRKLANSARRRHSASS